MTTITKAAQQALAALETCRIRSVTEWEVTDVTPKNVTQAIDALRAALQDKAGEVTVAIDSLYNERMDGMTNAIFPPVQIGTRLFAAQPAQVVPELSSIAQRKLSSLQADGWVVNGYAIRRGDDRGFVDASGFVGWWRGEIAPVVPDDVARDAARYRWIRGNTFPKSDQYPYRITTKPIRLDVGFSDPDTFDAAIDASMKNAQQSAG